MKQKQLFDIFLFLVGFAFGFYLNLSLKIISSQKNFYKKIKLPVKVNQNKLQPLNKIYSNNSQGLYEHELADFLFNEVKIVCFVFTHPDNHKTKVPHVRQTWGRKCNKLLFMSIENDPDQPDIIALPVKNGRKHLRQKTRLAMKYVYENHFKDADWFLRADDDNFIVMENLRHKLYQYHSQTSLYIGHRFGHKFAEYDGFMAGGGHVFSKKALQKYVTVISPNASLCAQYDGEAADLMVGVCISKYALFVDFIDDKNEKQHFPLRVEEHLANKKLNMSSWYQRYLWTNVTQGGPGCCSDIYIGSHYVKPKKMYLKNFLIYNVHPFGLQKNSTEKLPRKLSLDEIIKASDAPSLYTIYYKEHEKIHFIDEDEKYDV